MSDPPAARPVWLARWVAVAGAAVVVARLEQLLPAGDNTAYLGAAAYGVPLVAGLLLRRWGWTAVLAGGLLGAQAVPTHGWVGVAAATLTAVAAGHCCRRGWPFDPALARLTDVGQLARLAAGLAVVQGLATGVLAAVVGIPGAARDGVTAANLSLAGSVILGAVAGGLWARSARPLVALPPLAILAGLVLFTHRYDPQRPLVNLSAGVWWAGSIGLAGVCLGALALAAVTRERRAEAAVRDRLLTDLKAVSADLLRRRAAMEALLDQLPVGVLFLDPDGQVVRQNRQYRDGLKLPTDFPELRPGATTDSGVWRVARPDGSPVAVADWSVSRAVREGKVADREARVLAADGAWRDVRINSAPVTDPDSGGPGAVFVVADLTARKQAERDRQAAEDRLHEALASARMYAWEWNPAADRIDMFGQFREVLGLPADGPVPRTMAEFVALIHPADRAAREPLTADLAAGRQTEYESEFRVIRSDGAVGWVSSRGRAVRHPDGTPTGRLAGVTLDVTARKQAEERAAQAEALARFALTAAGMSAWEWDLASGRVTRSDPMHDWLGLPPDTPLDRTGTLLPLMHPDDRRRYDALLPEVMAGREFENDIRLRHTDGGWRWLRSRGRGVVGPDGRVERIAGVHQDVTAEKEGEERLRLLESAVVHARDAVIILAADPADGAGRSVRYVNAAFERMTGYPSAEVVGRSLSLLGGPATDPHALARLRDALDAGRPLVTELLNYHRAGAEVWVELSLVPVPDDAGAVSHFVMIQRDVTDRKRAEAAVRESEERLRAIGDSLPDGAVFQFVLDPAGRPRIPYISAGIERMIGVSPAEITADAAALMDRMAEADRGLFAARKARSAADLSTCDMEFRFTARDGREVTCYGRSQPARLPGGGVLWNGVLLDVTARRRAEEALRQSEARFRSMFENVAAGVTESDPDGRYLSVNPAFAAQLGRPVEQVVGRRAVEFSHPDDWAVQQPYIAAVAAGERDEYQITKRYCRPDGSVVWVELWVSALREPDGRVKSTLGVSVDVTERRRLEEQLLQAQKMEAVGQLAGGIAHDFNNLLTGVIGHLGLVDLPAADPNRAYLQTAEKAAGRAVELTQKLLGFARKSQLLLAPVPVAACVAEVLDLLRPNLGRAVTLVADVAAADTVLADPALIGQVVLNLCLNARDAMPDGGTLTVGTAAVDVSPAEAAAHPHGQPGPHVRIRVADTGTGIPPEVLARVFEPFFTTKSVGKGTGLGLAMVDGIVRQHGGWVAVVSEVGVGTRFDIFLQSVCHPARGTSGALKWSQAERAETADLTVTPPPRSRAAPGTVLLVDDEEMIRLLGRSVLEDAGYTVLEAEDGADAVDLFRDRHADIDLVVMDLTMPRMSGREAYRRMADLVPSARVLLSSGYSSDDLSDMAGAVGLLAKPYRPAELVAAVRQALGATAG